MSGLPPRDTDLPISLLASPYERSPAYIVSVDTTFSTDNNKIACTPSRFFTPVTFFFFFYLLPPVVDCLIAVELEEPCILTDACHYVGDNDNEVSHQHPSAEPLESMALAVMLRPTQNEAVSSPCWDGRLESLTTTVISNATPARERFHAGHTYG